ncbi:MAG: DUF1080 domain-containing protein [Kiritimatiellia bacterium]|nr:DUF1080 domain-containing protein [Kiritimatiellia bacterium]MDP6848204.1 DUF1080 domain-containing protein [Kiritimatiellia bacterium]
MQKILTVFTLVLFVAVTSGMAGHPDTSGKEWIRLAEKDLTGWMNANGQAYDGKTATKDGGKGWVVEDGVMKLEGKGGGYIWTQRRFGDFMFDFEVNTTGNSGVFFRTDNPRNCVQTGFEMQVLPKGGPGQKNGFGAIYNCQAPSKPVGNGEWNHVTLTCKDNMITIVINGEVINEMDVNKWTTGNKNPDGSKNKFKTPIKDFKREGHIGLQDHGAKVTYRNIKIKELIKAMK